MPQINNNQKTLIHIGISELGIDDETYRLMLAGYGVDTCKNLQYSQASAFIDDLVKKGFRIKRKYRKAQGVRRKVGNKSSNVIFLPTKQQLALIEHLRADILWRVHDGYQRFVTKMLGRAYLKTNIEAQKLIEALKGVLRSQERGYGQKIQKEG
jgi:hypothetical protein